MFEITIRNAVFEDAAEMANIHINSWRETYGYILPKEYLDERPLYFKNRYELWKKVTVNSSQISIVAECSDNGVVGFINGAKARDTDKEDCCEVWSFYLLKKYHGKKIGYNLLQEFFKKQLALGFSKAYLWVLAGNPTISFYERSGAMFTGDTIKDNIAGIDVSELCYQWDQLK